MSMYLRFKRCNQTIFIHCEPNEVLQEVKKRLANVLDKDEDEIKLFPYLTEEKKLQLFAQLDEKAKESAKNAKKEKKEQKKDDLSLSATASLGSAQAVDPNRPRQVPPLDCDKKVWDLLLENDQVIFFVYKTSDTDDLWEEVEAEGLVLPSRQGEGGQPSAGAPAGASSSASSSSNAANSEKPDSNNSDAKEGSPAPASQSIKTSQ